MKEKIIYPRKIKLLETYSVVSIVLLLVLYFIFGGRFAYFNKTPEQIQKLLISDLIVLLVWIAFNVLFIFLLFKYSFYVITNSELIHRRMNKDLHFKFDDILYIDIEYTLKHKTLLFYTNKGDSRFLIMDKENTLYDEVKSRCKNLITKEQFHGKFPNIKL